MNAVNVKLVGNSVVIVKGTKENHSLYMFEINRLRKSRNLEVVKSATSIYDDLIYSVLVPNKLSKSKKLDIINSAIKDIDSEERNDVQQLNMSILRNTQFNLIHN